MLLLLVGAGRLLLGPRRGLRSRTSIWFWALSALIMRFQAANNFSTHFSIFGVQSCALWLFLLLLLLPLLVAVVAV